MMDKTQWFRDAKWGVFTHFLADDKNIENPEQWNALIDNFDVKGLACQLNECGARYYFMTIGQCSGYFLSPNATYDRLVGRTPSCCSRRDIILELIEALRPYGIRMMVYLPSHAPSRDRQAVEKLQCTPPWNASKWGLNPGMYVNETNVDNKLTVFQNNWEAIISEWSMRWGDGVHGWFFDGCYYADVMYRDAASPDFKSFAAAARSGNKDSIVAFNSGVSVPAISTTEYEDYTAGEVSVALPITNTLYDAEEKQVRNGKVNGKQYHILTYAGQFWWTGAPRFTPELFKSYTDFINSLSGVMTWDVPILPSGLIPAEYIQLLKMLG